MQAAQAIRTQPMTVTKHLRSNEAIKSAKPESQRVTRKLTVENAIRSALIADYPFNGNTIDAHSGNACSNNGNGAKLVPGRSGIANTAYSFDGASYLNCGNSVGPAANIKTIETYIKFKVLTEPMEIISKSTIHYGVELVTYKGGVTLVVMPGEWSGVNDISVTIPFSKLNTQDWHHIVATQDGPGGKDMKIYLNSNLIASSKTPYGIADGTDFMMGSWASKNSAETGPRYFQGSLDNVRLYDRALTGSEVNYLYTVGLPDANTAPTVPPTATPTFCPTTLQTFLSTYFPTDSPTFQPSLGLNSPYPTAQPVVMPTFSPTVSNPEGSKDSVFNGTLALILVVILATAGAGLLLYCFVQKCVKSTETNAPNTRSNQQQIELAPQGHLVLAVAETQQQIQYVDPNSIASAPPLELEVIREPRTAKL